MLFADNIDPDQTKIRCGKIQTLRFIWFEAVSRVRIDAYNDVMQWNYDMHFWPNFDLVSRSGQHSEIVSSNSLIWKR